MSVISNNVPVLFPVPLTNKMFKAIVDIYKTEGATFPANINYGQFDPQQHYGLKWDGQNPVQWVHSAPEPGEYITLEKALMENQTLFEDAIYADYGTTWRVDDLWVIKQKTADGWALFVRGTGVPCSLNIVSSRKYLRVEGLNRWQPTVSAGPIHSLTRDFVSFPKASLRNHVQDILKQLHFLATCPGAGDPESHKYIVYFDGSKWATKTLNGNQKYSEILGMSFSTSAEMTQAANHANLEFGYEA